MAKPVNDDELQLKKRARRRLVGAVVLVLLVVVFLPMVLDNERKPLSGNVVIQIPPAPSVDKAFPSPSGDPAASQQQPAAPGPAIQPPPLAADAAGSPGASSEPARNAPPDLDAKAEPAAGPESAPPAKPEAKPEPAPVPKPAPKHEPKAEAKPAPKPEPKAEAKPAPKPEPKSEATAAPKPAAKANGKPAAKPELVATKPEARRGAPDAAPGGFVVQLGAFSDPDNARALLGRLKDAQIPAYSETAKTPSGTKTRVRAGPYPTEAAAEKGRDRVLTLKIAAGELKVARQGD